MPKGQRLKPQVLAKIVGDFKRLRATQPSLGIMECCQYIADRQEPRMDVNHVWKVVDRFRPTAMLASDYLRSQAFRLAKRLVKEAQSGEVLDLLSRSSMGVVSPKQVNEGGGQGFVLSVQADSCGAVRLGMAVGPQSLPGTSEETDAEIDSWRDERIQPGTAPQRFLEGGSGDESETGAGDRLLGAGGAGSGGGRGGTGADNPVESRQERLARLQASAKARLEAARAEGAGDSGE